MCRSGVITLYLLWSFSTAINHNRSGYNLRPLKYENRIVATNIMEHRKCFLIMPSKHSLSIIDQTEMWFHILNVVCNLKLRRKCVINLTRGIYPYEMISYYMNPRYVFHATSIIDEYGGDILIVHCWYASEEVPIKFVDHWDNWSMDLEENKGVVFFPDQYPHYRR